VRRLVGGWDADPLWGSFYDWTVEHPRAGGALWRAGIQSDLRLLYDAAGEIGRQPAGSRVLDVPCGGGVAARSLRPDQGVDYVAADISQRMIDRTLGLAAELGVADQVTGRLADVEDLPFPDGSFDAVVSTMVLCTVPDPAAAMAEIRRLLRPDGRLLFIEHVRADDEPRLARWQDRLEAPWRAFGEGCRCNQPTLRLLDEAGLRPTRLGHDRWRGLPRIVAPLVMGEAA
jgi:SAM-dependent methyltransferase